MCFEIEQTLQERLDIPVFHDDQHGTAIIAGAGFINALDITGRKPEDVKVVFSGAGAAGIATARFFIQLGVKPENTLMVDSKGVIHSGRTDLTETKLEFVRDTEARTLADALAGADAFVGVSIAGCVTGDMIREMAPDPIIFALANPDPEISYEEAREVRPDAIVATGRSDYPNEVNNVLGFPFIFRGALDVRAQAVSEGMKVAAAQALAELAREPVPDSVLRAYNLERLQFGRDYIIPKPFDPRVLVRVAPAVALAASQEGLARTPLEDVEAYREALRARFQASHSLITTITAKARTQPMRVAYPHGHDLRIIRAARRVLDEGIANPVLVGDVGLMKELASEAGVSLEGIEMVDPNTQEETRRRYAATLEELRRHKGISLHEAQRWVLDPNMYACLMVREGAADAVLGGLTTFYAETIRPALQVLRVEEGRTIVSSLYVVVIGGKSYFFTDCAVNIEPTSEQLVEIAEAAVDIAQRQFDREPRVGFISYSDFGSAGGEEPARVRKAVETFRERHPDIPVDGEMQAGTAVVDDLLRRRRPDGPLQRAPNVLVFPNLTAANASYQLLNRIAGAEVIGPILSGLSKSVHVLQRDAEVTDVVNLTAVAVADAQRRRRAKAI